MITHYAIATQITEQHHADRFRQAHHARLARQAQPRHRTARAYTLRGVGVRGRAARIAAAT